MAAASAVRPGLSSCGICHIVCLGFGSHFEATGGSHLLNLYVMAILGKLSGGHFVFPPDCMLDIYGSGQRQGQVKGQKASPIKTKKPTKRPVVALSSSDEEDGVDQQAILAQLAVLEKS